MNRVLYRFTDPYQLERLVESAGSEDRELGVPVFEGALQDGEWVLAVFELEVSHRETSAAARVTIAPDGPRLVFEPRDWATLAKFARREARRGASSESPASSLSSERGVEVELATADGPSSVAGEPLCSSAKDRVRILIVDDDPDIRSVVSAMLAAVGLTPEPVGSAEEALTRVEVEPYDLVVLDWNLPKMTGIDLCRLLRGREAFDRMPILFLTANASAHDAEQAFASGADDYVVKPFRAPELRARIWSLLRRADLASS